MKILHTADWHIGQFKGPVVDGVNLRSQDTVKCLEYMVQVAIEEKPDIVCVSGDIFHQEQVGPVRYSDEMITATNIITSLAHFSKYVCQVDQMIMGIDQIRQTDLSRRQGPTTMQPKQQRVKTIAEQANIHQDRLFAESYFKAGA